MNDYEIDKYFEDINSDVSSSIENRILSDSCKALKRGCFIRKSARRGVFTFAILVFGFAAFLTGQFSVNKNTVAFLANIDHDDIVTITVHKDFLTWIDAGYFFAHIEMKDKANEAFNRAISLIPKEELNIMAQSNRVVEKPFLSSLANREFPSSDTMAMVNVQLPANVKNTK